MNNFCTRSIFSSPSFRPYRHSFHLSPFINSSFYQTPCMTGPQRRLLLPVRIGPRSIVTTVLSPVLTTVATAVRIVSETLLLLTLLALLLGLNGGGLVRCPLSLSDTSTASTSGTRGSGSISVGSSGVGARGGDFEVLRGVGGLRSSTSSLRVVHSQKAMKTLGAVATTDSALSLSRGLAGRLSGLGVVPA